MAGRRKVADVRRMKDPAVGFNYTAEIVRIPGNSGINLDDLVVRVQTTEIPEVQTESTEVTIGGMTKHFALRKVWTHQLPVEFIEVRSYETWKALFDWSNLTMDKENIGAYKDDYSTDIILTAYDAKDRGTNRLRLVGCWLETFGPVAFDSSAADAIRIPAVIHFHYYDYVSAFPLTESRTAQHPAGITRDPPPLTRGEAGGGGSARTPTHPAGITKDITREPDGVADPDSIIPYAVTDYIKDFNREVTPQVADYLIESLRTVRAETGRANLRQAVSDAQSPNFEDFVNTTVNQAVSRGAGFLADTVADLHAHQNKPRSIVPAAVSEGAAKAADLIATVVEEVHERASQPPPGITLEEGVTRVAAGFDFLLGGGGEESRERAFPPPEQKFTDVVATVPPLVGGEQSVASRIADSFGVAEPEPEPAVNAEPVFSRESIERAAAAGPAIVRSLRILDGEQVPPAERPDVAASLPEETLPEPDPAVNAEAPAEAGFFDRLKGGYRDVVAAVGGLKDSDQEESPSLPPGVVIPIEAEIEDIEDLPAVRGGV